MATGLAWQIEEESPDVPKPWAYFDKDAILDIPYHWETWLSDKGATYASHTIIVAAGLIAVQSSQLAGVVTVRVKKDPALPLTPGMKYPVTVRIVASDGQSEDQTLFLRITDR